MQHRDDMLNGRFGPEAATAHFAHTAHTTTLNLRSA
ncbi:MAG: hypothetical protein ACI90Y_002607 [Polaromonas sp.]